MKLLVLSFYFPPDLCAGSFRCEALIDALERKAPQGLDVTVVTTQPNRYKGSIDAAPPQERRGMADIHRIALPEHDSGLADQARSFTKYAREAAAIAQREGPYDAVFATSSRLMTASLGAWLSRKLGVPLYLDIRDLFAETIGDVMGPAKGRVVGPVASQIERITFARADTINVVSPGFNDHVRRIAPRAKLRNFTNGIDDAFLTLGDLGGEGSAGDLPTILYAGNIGEGQGLHRVVPQAAAALQGKARFCIIGHGGRAAQLREAVEGLSNVELLPPVPRAALIEHYRDADILFLHLNDHPAFLKVLPSKLFEYGALGMPILAGLSGVSAQFLRDEIPWAQVFAPCDPGGLADAFDRLERPAPEAVARFKTRFARATIMDEMAADILAFTRQAAR